MDAGDCQSPLEIPFGIFVSMPLVFEQTSRIQ
jgi:hypothetical protein